MITVVVVVVIIVIAVINSFIYSYYSFTMYLLATLHIYIQHKHICKLVYMYVCVNVYKVLYECIDIIGRYVH